MGHLGVAYNFLYLNKDFDSFFFAFCIVAINLFHV